MYKTFTLPLKSAIALAGLFILTACGGFTIDLDSLVGSSNCLANPFESECDNDAGITKYRELIIEDCNANPEKANTVICTAAEAATNPPSDNENSAEGADNTPKNTEVKIEFDKDSLTKTDKEKAENTGLEIVDLCTNPATADDKQCTPAVIDCINRPFSGSCQGDNVLGNFVRGDVTVSKAVVLQTKRAEDCRTGRIDRALCQNLSVQKQRCTGAELSTDDAICSAVRYSVCKADVFDPLCGEKEDVLGVYFNERSDTCYEDPNNPNCTGSNGHIAVACSEYPFDRLCTDNTDYDDARADACEANPDVSSSCPVVDVCLENPFGLTCADSDYNNARKDLVKTCIIQAVTGAVTSACSTITAAIGPCFKNPFDTTCDANPAVRSYIAQLRSNRVALCNSNFRVASYCTGVPVPDTTPVGEITTVAPEPTTPQVTAEVWANSFDEPLSTEATVDHLYNTESQFLIGRATDLDNGRVRPYFGRNGNLNLADATFNGVALGGDRADGLAFLITGPLYAGILSGTNLGAPLTDTTGSAKWIGSFQLAGYSPTDFVLNVSFGTGSGAGEIEAIIQRYVYFTDHHIKGEFDDAGVITGTADTGFYRRSDPANRRGNVTTHHYPGKLTGLIGEEGAVGAFIVDDLYSVGGFVARPSSVAELADLEQTCADDPFNKLCTVGYESERNAVLDHCIIGGNANDASCDSANELDSCIKHPFSSGCEASLPDHYQQARVNRLAFCRTAGNAGNELCTADTTFAHICTNYPFDAQCLGDNDYTLIRRDACSSDPFATRCTGDVYNDLRESACASNPNSSRCSGTLARVCGGNPFDTLCRNTTVYLNARINICRGNPLDGRCGWTISTICNSNPFDTVCGNPGWNNAREIACRGGTATAGQCRDVIAGVCGANPFDTLCGDSGWNNARASACRNGSTNTQCGGIIAGVCGNNPFDSLCGGSYTQNRRNACSDDPFTPRCAGNVYNDLRVSFCEDNVGTHPSCPAPTPTPTEVTAKVWVDSFDEPLSHAASADDTSDKFLIGKETDLDTGGLRPYSNDPNFNYGNLNFADSTFNGAPLGGDRADGVAFFAARADSYGFYYSYSGILSGTNLGAPLTDTTGSAKWIGSFRIEQRFATDFVLNISFGAGDGAGEIEALIQRYNFTYQDDYIIGEFNDAGVITGTVQSGRFRTNDPDNRGYVRNTGKLTGIIGEEGAVGAFLMDGLFGGFVARPTSAEELQTLEQTCTDDPFNRLCAVGYESERIARIEHCIIGGNANDTARCGFVKEWLLCIHDPFKTLCNILMPEHYEQTRANRIAFCRNADNAENALCTVETTFAHICANHPFDALCRGDNDYRPIRRNACTDNPFAPRCAGDTYNDLRVSFCTVNAGNPACPQPVVPTTTSDRVTTADWVASFDGELPSQPDENNLESGFLEATADALNSGTLGLSSYYPHTHIRVKMYNLNLDTATYDGKYLNGDAADGVAFFEGEPYQGAGDFAYAGILAGTDLGAPLNQTGTATWHGTINETSWFTKNTDFSLDIEFNGSAGGKIKGFAASPYNGRLEENYYLRIRGSFDKNGVIKGTTNKGRFTDDNPDLPRPGKYSGRIVLGTLTGLIGEEGAVGAFVQGSYAGGFVVRPSAAFDSPEPLVNNARVTTADWLNSFNEDLPVRGRTPIGRTDKNHFVQASKTGLALQNKDKTWYKAVTFADATFDGKVVGGDAADGFALSSNPSHYTTHHAGILSGTDLGAPLTQRQGSASWEGRMIILSSWNRAVFTDFILHINFGAGNQVGTLTGQVRTLPGRADYKYKVDGQFNEAGVITGTSEYGNFNHEDTKIPRYWRHTGTLSGLIGEEGAVGVFISKRNGYDGYVGGFIAAPSLQDYVTSADLKDYYHLTMPTDPLFRNETSIFLAASSTGEMDTSTLLTRDGSTPTVETLTLANATYQGRGLGGDATDGISFFKGWKGRTDTLRSTKIHYRVYSGIFDDINLGEPVTQTSGKAYWKGQFKSVHFDRVVSKDFTLEVSFSEGLGLGAAGRINALVHDTGLKHFAVSATFNNRGVIDGGITFGDYENNAQSGSIRSYTRGELVGLIGQEGALAIFKTHPTTGSSRSPELAFAGGFAVVPNLPDLPTPAPDTTPNRVTTADWLASFGTAPATVPTDYRDQFLQGSETELNTGRLRVSTKWWGGPSTLYGRTFADTAFDGVEFDGDATGGFSSFKGISSGSYVYGYAGILAGTDLGAPLTQTTGSVRWNGVFRAEDHYGQHDFALIITFGGEEHAGTLNGYVQKNLLGQHYTVEGYFDDKGVIGGTVTEWGRASYTINISTLRKYTWNTELTGIIGSRGAVAAFTGSDVGGFMASPDMELSPKVTEKDWRESFNGKILSIDGTRNDPGLAAFSQGGDQNALVGTTRKGFLAINSVPNTYQDSVGVSFFTAIVDGRTRHYAGIFRRTRLGNPLTVLPAVNGNPVTATWNGQLGIIANDSAVSLRDIDLSVDFTNQTISHSSVLNTGRKSISLDGTWTDNGVIDGTITYDPNPVPNAVNARAGVVRGLIGQYGAIGAFISNDDVTDTPFAGGFVAEPPSQ